MTRNGRTDIAEAVIDEVRRELGDREAGALLATCGDVTAGRLLPEILYAVASLAPLARRHPGALLDHIEEQLAALPSRQRDLLWHQVGTALPALATADPDRVLRLVEDLGPSHVIPYGIQPVLGRLIRFAPARVAALVVDDGYILTIRWHLPIALRRNIWWFSPADRTAIARALREHEHLLLSVIGLLLAVANVSPARSQGRRVRQPAEEEPAVGSPYEAFSDKRIALIVDLEAAIAHQP